MPTNSTDAVKALIDLIPVVGGATIGVISGLVGTAYSSKLSRASEKVKEKRERLERLVTESYEIDVWLKKQENYYLYGGEEILEQSPISKIEALQALYFADLDDCVKVLSDKTLAYRGWLLTGAQLRLSAKTACPPKEHLDKLGEHYSPLKESISKLIEKAKEIGKALDAS